MQSGHSESHNQFLEANAASARALGEDAELDTNLNADGDRLPLDVIAPPNTKCQQSIRGLADSLALIHLNHDPELHASVAPAGALANRLFVAMERARCEACCNPRHTGVVANMASLWSSTNGQVTRHSAAESELLPVLVGSTIRDALGISAAHIATKELHDKYLEAVANGKTTKTTHRQSITQKMNPMMMIRPSPYRFAKSPMMMLRQCKVRTQIQALIPWIWLIAMLR